MSCLKPLGLLLGLTLCLQQQAYAEQGDASAFLQIRAQHAYNAVFGLPAVASRPVQTREWQLSLEHSNQFMGGKQGEEVLKLDGETSELTIRHRQRIGSCWQAELALPFIQHSGGQFDRAISDWHSFFGFPNAQRDESPIHAISYTYTDENGQRAGVSRAESGLGDIQLSVQRSLGCQATADSTRSESIARLGLKLPTGDVEELRGSGKFDLYADVQSPVLSMGRKLRLGAALGAMVVGQSTQLPEQRSLLVYGSLGSHFVLTQRLRLLAQLDWHTPFYQSGLRELGDPAVALTIGARYLGPADQTLEISISEDAHVDTIPDIVVRLAWTYRPAGGL